jgi:hypothetical protein
MSCKIERLATSEGTVVFRVSGDIQVEHVNTIQDLIVCEGAPVGFDLSETMLVDRDAVTYLALCELNGIQLRNCPPFLREWVTKEELHQQAERKPGARSDPG